MHPDNKNADTIVRIAQMFGVDAKVIGQIAKSKDNQNHVTIKQDDKEYDYSK